MQILEPIESPLQNATARDRFSQNKPLWARAIAQSCPEFGSTNLRVISGQIPASLRGTFYQNGPGLLERGNQRIGHWFDGDGGILAVHFTDAGATGLYRYVKTAGFLAEQQKDRFIYPGFAQKAPFWRSRTKNPANTSVIAVEDKLLALWEMGNPHALDLNTLETLGLDNLGTLKKNQAFGAHPKRDSQTGEIYNFGFGYRYTNYKVVPSLNLFHCDATGKIRRKAEISLKRFSFIHDFALVGPYLIFLVPPIQVDILRLTLGISNLCDVMQWQPQLGTQVIIVDRETFQEVGRYETEPWFQLHIGNGYVDRDGSVVIDFVRHPDSQSLQSMTEVLIDFSVAPVASKLWRIRINLQNGKLLENIQLLDRNCELPVVSPSFVGSKAPYVYVCSDPTEKANSSYIFSSIACVNTQTGKASFAEPGQSCYVAEPIYAPDKSAPNLGWILTVVFDANQDQSRLHIYHAERIDEGPVCVLELPHIVPFGFHGTWRAAIREQMPISNTNDTCSVFPVMRNSTYQDLPTKKLAVRRVAVLGVMAALASGGIMSYGFLRFASTKPSSSMTPATSNLPKPKVVTALGRLEPKGEVIKLSAPTSIEGTRVDRLLVKQGDKVRVNQVVAILDNYKRLIAALEKAKQEVEVARSHLAQVKAGAKAGEINAQMVNISSIEAEQRGQITVAKAGIARLKAELHNAQTEYQRHESLYTNGAISASNRDTKHLISSQTELNLKRSSE